MMIRSASPNLSEPKTLKVSLPTKMHLVLHQLKILTGRNISETVETALLAYFEELKAQQDGAAAGLADQAVAEA